MQKKKLRKKQCTKFIREKNKAQKNPRKKTMHEKKISVKICAQKKIR